MRKITLLLTLLLTFAGTAWAQPWTQPVVSTDDNVYEYYIRNVRNPDYYVTTTTGLAGGAQQLGSANSFSDAKAKVTFKLMADGKLYATNVATSSDAAATPLFVGYVGGNTDEGPNKVQLFAEDNNYTWNIEPVTSGVTLSAGTSDQSWNMHGGAGANIGLYAKTDGGSNWEFVPANDAAKDICLSLMFADAEDYYYQFKNVGYSKMIASNAEKATVVAANSDAYQMWKLESVPDADFKFYLKNAATGKYLKHSTETGIAWTVCEGTAEAGAFTFKYMNAAVGENLVVVAIMYDEADPYNSAHIEGSETSIVRWTWEDNQTKSQWYVIKTDIPSTNEVVDVTYNFYDGGTLASSEATKVVVGADYPAFTNIPGYVNVTGIPETPVAETITLNLQCSISEGFPFKGSFGLSTRSGTKWLTGSEGGQALSAPLTIENKSETDVYTWSVEGTWYNGFNFKNKETNMYLAAPKESPDDRSATVLQGAVDDKAKFDIVLNNGNYYIKLHGTNDNYVSDVGGDTNNSLKFWNTTANIGDAGSMFVVESVDPAVLLAAFKEANAPIVGYVGGYDATAEEINALTVESVEEFIANTAKVQLQSGQYYRIYTAYAPLYAKNKGLIYNVEGSASNPFRWGTIEETNVDAIVRLTVDNGKYVLQTVNTGNYMQGVGGASAATMSENGHFTLTDLGYAQYNLVFGNGTMHANGHGGGLGEEGNVVSYGGAANTASAWYLVPATELKVALTAVEGASYATGYYPFPVSASGNTTLNVGTLNADKSRMTLTAVDGILANTGVVIVNSAAEAVTTLTIGGEYAAASSNALTGSCTAITENISNYLVLGIGANSGALGFYETTAEAIPANKAFLEAGSLSAVKLNLGGEATAIENVELSRDNAPVFDLSGRRILTPVKGGVYIQNGKKFIVK